MWNRLPLVLTVAILTTIAGCSDEQSKRSSKSTSTNAIKVIPVDDQKEEKRDGAPTEALPKNNGVVPFPVTELDFSLTCRWPNNKPTDPDSFQLFVSKKLGGAIYVYHNRYRYDNKDYYSYEHMILQQTAETVDKYQYKKLSVFPPTSQIRDAVTSLEVDRQNLNVTYFLRTYYVSTIAGSIKMDPRPGGETYHCRQLGEAEGKERFLAIDARYQEYLDMKKKEQLEKEEQKERERVEKIKNQKI